jgi:hypothetical protein
MRRRGHEEVPVYGQVVVLAGGQLKVRIPRPSFVVSAGFARRSMLGHPVSTGISSIFRCASFCGFDTAQSYGTERGVGKAIAASDIPREELYVTSKLAGRNHRPDDVRRSF